MSEERKQKLEHIGKLIASLPEEAQEEALDKSIMCLTFAASVCDKQKKTNAGA